MLPAPTGEFGILDNEMYG